MRDEGGHAAHPRPVAVDDAVLSRLVSEEVRDVHAILADGERRPVVLVYSAGAPAREVATLFGEPEGTEISRIRNGLARLHAEMTGTSFERSIIDRSGVR